MIPHVFKSCFAGTIGMVLCFSIVFAITTSQAQIPQTINYQGVLTEPSGAVVPDGNFNLTFKLFDVSTSGTALWIETQTIAVNKGIFNVVLGNVNPLILPFDQPYWLEVTVGAGPELTPRIQLTSSAYSLNTRSIRDGGVVTEKLADEAVTTPKIQDGAVTQAKLAAGIALPPGPHNHLFETWSGNDPYKAFTIENLGAGDGIQGWAHSDASGLHGRNTGNGPGASGFNLSGGAGVYGKNFATGDGVFGEASASNKSGVYAVNTGDGYGVFARSSTGWGAAVDGNHGSNADRYGDLLVGGDLGEIFCFGHLGIYADHDVYIDLDDDNNDTDAKFVVFDGTNTFRMTVDEKGDLWTSGTKSAMVQTANHGQRLLYAIESPNVWFEDFGQASLLNGETTVTFESTFTEAVNLQADYHVFLTPVSQNPVLLFVTAKNATNFTVRGVTLDGTPAQGSFDYRIVAKRLGYENVRMESVTTSPAR